MAEPSQIPNNQNNVRIPIEDDDSEWEYEYHETETDTFYVNLDLSSHSVVARAQQRLTVPNPTATTVTRASPSVASTSSNDHSPHSHATQNPAPSPTEAIQILDLHGSNPLISYRNRFYSCTWSTSLGTDLLLTSSPSSPHPPILAATRIKLSARPVRVFPSHKPPQDPIFQPQQLSVVESSIPVGNKDTIQGSTTPPAAPIHSLPTPKIPLEKHATLARRNQAQFLERLMAAKAAKGERDEVTVYAKKTYTGTGWRARQRIERELEEEEEDAVGVAGGESIDADHDENDEDDNDDDDDDDDDDEDDDDEADEDEDAHEDEDDDEESTDEETDPESDRDPPNPKFSLLPPQPSLFSRGNPSTFSLLPPQPSLFSRGNPSRRPRGRPRANRFDAGGLFRDYRPSGSTTGMPGDSRGNNAIGRDGGGLSIPTPRSWEELVPKTTRGSEITAELGNGTRPTDGTRTMTTDTTATKTQIVNTPVTAIPSFMGDATATYLPPTGMEAGNANAPNRAVPVAVDDAAMHDTSDVDVLMEDV